jgi:hypothetical protein
LTTATADNVRATRGLLETVLSRRIEFRPFDRVDGAAMYELIVPLQFDRLLTIAIPSLARVGLASLSTTSWNRIRRWLESLRVLQSLSRAAEKPLRTV